MVSRTLAFIGLTLQQTVLAQDCMSSFESGKKICESNEDETNPMSMCKPECLQALNATLPQCMKGETFVDDEGKTQNIAEMLTEVFQMCTDPCMSAFASGRMICESNEDETNPMSMCKPDCLQALNATLPLCMNGETFDDDDGETQNIAKMLTEALQMCTNPCMTNILAIVGQGCLPMGEDEQSDFDPASMCSEDCKGSYASFPTECREQDFGDTSFGDIMDNLQATCEPCMQAFMALMPCTDTICTPHCGGLLTMATAACMTSDVAVDVDGVNVSISSMLPAWSMSAMACAPSPAPAPSPGSTGCVHISKAMAEKWNAKRCY